MSDKSRDQTLLASIRATTLESLKAALGERNEEVVYLDTPRHRNLGDTLIWKGATSYIEQLGYRIAAETDQARHPHALLKRLGKSATIVMHGGGNLGDLYITHERYRRWVVETYQQNRIVLMPQSLHFRDPSELAESKSTYEAADHLKILLREPQSLSLASDYFPNTSIAYCPDLAFGCDFLPARPPEASAPVRVLARNDEEALGPRLPGSRDWRISGKSEMAWWSIISVTALLRRSPSQLQGSALSFMNAANRALKTLNIRSAQHQFDGVPHVVTDRLHAHILCTLLEVPHHVCDNSYGKISAIFDAYSGGFSTANWCASIDHGLNLVGERH